MNKTLVTLFMALGLLLIDTPQAAAHDKSRTAYRVPSHYWYDAHYRDHRQAMPVRASRMPRWLHEDRSFRHWYKHCRLQHNLYLSWYELYDIYRWENSRDRHRRSHSRNRH
ncbi:MAG: hypothetical protein OEY74_04425 [Gammaproteobacteria bacterium]|nr:hypothetical protein [Gammaproteobacteria bacterium]